MPVWDLNSAIASTRSLISDGAGDKFEFKTPVAPTPDSVTTRFFVGQTRLVADSLEVYHNGVQVAPSGIEDIHLDKGSFTYAPSGVAPSGDITASFYYQWFKDDEITQFLYEAANMLSFESPSGDVIAIGLRPTLQQFALYNAYMRKAAEFAETVTASAGGYTFDRKAAHPNWAGLADKAFKNGQDKLKLYLDDPLSSQSPQIAIIEFRLNRYQPL